MEICLMIEGQENVSWEDWIALALACEEHGLDGLFRSDHYLSFGHPTDWGSLDAWALLPALALKTERIRFGTLVSPVAFRHPSVLAKSVVTADYASEGRIELGMGAGWFEGEHRAFGFNFPPDAERIDMLEEQVEIVHRLWDRDEDEVTFQGKHYRLEGVHALPKPLQDPHPPLILGGGAGARAARLAARWADEYNMNFVPIEDIRLGSERLDAACEAIGRDPASLRHSVMTNCLVGADEGDLLKRATGLMERRGAGGEASDFIEQMGPERMVGTTDQVLEKLAAYAEAGIERVMLQHLVHQDLEMVALIGQAIVPDAADL